ncbi:MAG: sulfite exporter TauE/SafE family protein [Acidimicrobiales bacterium]
MSVLAGLAAVVIGFLSGILSGMFGVGGAVLTTPGVRLLGATPIEAVGSTIPAILPGSLSGALRYARKGMVDWHVATTCGLIGSAMAVAGGALSDHVNAHYLMLLTAALLLWTGVKDIGAVRAPARVVVPAVDDDALILEADEGRSGDVPLARVGAIGAAAGLLAGLLGVGGGILMVPAFSRILHLSPKRAVATSLVAVAIFSVPAMITHALLGHINWGFALCLLAGVVPGAQIGAHLTIGGSERRLRILSGTFFSVLAIAYGISELRAL